jgi:hypothetical protein
MKDVLAKVMQRLKAMPDAEFEAKLKACRDDEVALALRRLQREAVPEDAELAS